MDGGLVANISDVSAYRFEGIDLRRFEAARDVGSNAIKSALKNRNGGNIVCSPAGAACTCQAFLVNFPREKRRKRNKKKACSAVRLYR